MTVIIPAKDRAEELRGCLESVFTQEYPADMIEVIVIDDGSRDETAGVARSFPCKLFSLEKSRGQSFCRNLAARVGIGEILAFLDSDCIAAKPWLRDLVPLFQWGRRRGRRRRCGRLFQGVGTRQVRKRLLIAQHGQAHDLWRERRFPRLCPDLQPPRPKDRVRGNRRDQGRHACR